MSDARELQWLEERIEAIQASSDWQSFCASQGPLGEHYAKYGWMPRHYDFIKARGFMMVRPILLPEARAFTDLFESAVIVKQEYNKSSRGGSYFSAPAGYVYIREATIAGHYGGTRSLDPTRTYGDGTPIRQHHGASWHVCYVKPRFEVPGFPSGRNFGMESGSFEAIKRTDGVLVTCNSRNSIGSEWVALLDGGDSLESLLSVADQEFLARERAVEKEAFGQEAEG